MTVFAAFFSSTGAYHSLVSKISPIKTLKFTCVRADFYLQLFSIEKGIDPNIAFYSVRMCIQLPLASLTRYEQLAVMNAAALPGRILPNILADRYGPYNVLIPCTVMCAVLMFCMFAITTVTGMIVFAIFYGFFSGAFLSLFGPCIAILSKDPSEIG
jgi:hypothetical protein